MPTALPSESGNQGDMIWSKKGSRIITLKVFWPEEVVGHLSNGLALVGICSVPPSNKIAARWSFVASFFDEQPDQ
jgi:hypothetical protein